MCFVAVVVQSRLNGLDRSLERAAMDLGYYAGSGFLQGDSAADVSLDRRRMDAGLHPVARRSCDRKLHHRAGIRRRCRSGSIRRMRLGVKPEINAICTLVIAAVAVVIIAASLASEALRRTGRVPRHFLVGFSDAWSGACGNSGIGGRGAPLPVSPARGCGLGIPQEQARVQRVPGRRVLALARRPQWLEPRAAQVSSLL